MCNECDGAKSLSRREFLRASLIGTGIAALGPWGTGILSAPSKVSAMPPGSQTMMTVLNLYGGNDGLNTLIPVNLANYYASRPNVGLDVITDNLLPLDQGPGGVTDHYLHYNLNNVQQLWNEGSVAFIQKTGYPTANLSHFLSQDIWSYGIRDIQRLGQYRAGWVARFADLFAPTPTGAVAIYNGLPLDMTGGTSKPFQAAQLSRFDFDVDNRYPDNHLHRLETIKNVLAATPRSGVPDEVGKSIGQAQDMAALVQQAVASFTGDPYWATVNINENIVRYMRDVAIMIEAGFDTRIFYTGFGGFDHHSGQENAGNGGSHPNLMRRLDDAIGAFADNMKALGVWNNMVVLVITEFGRRNYDNGSLGTDHAHTNALMAIGGAVNGGLHGPSWVETDFEPLVGQNNARRYPDYQVDFRDIYKAVLNDHLNVDANAVFPERQDIDTVLNIIT